MHHFRDFIGSHLISWMQKVKYLGVYVTSKLDWSFQCRHAASRATACLNCLRLIMYSSSPIAKAIACQVWSLYTN